MVNFEVSILAGGQSSRMGEDKGLMSLFGKPMIEYVIDEAAKLEVPIQLITNNPSYEKFNLPVHQDLYPNKGPLAGIYTALHYSKSEYNLILSCDIPYAKVELFKAVINQSAGFEVTIPQHEEQIHPLIGVYKKSIAEWLLKKITAGDLKILNAVKALSFNLIELNNFEHSNFKNVNSKSDF